EVPEETCVFAGYGVHGGIGGGGARAQRGVGGGTGNPPARRHLCVAAPHRRAAAVSSSFDGAVSSGESGDCKLTLASRTKPATTTRAPSAATRSASSRVAAGRRKCTPRIK